MGKTLKLTTTKLALIVFTLSFSFFTYGSSPTNPEKTISKKSIKIIGDAPAKIALEKPPKKSLEIEHLGLEYFYKDGEFFIAEGEGYMQTQAPIGVVVKSIPDDYQRIIISGKIYYYSKGVFYSAKGKKAYLTVYGPQGGQVSKLPEGCQTVSINGRNYFMYYDTIFRKAKSRSRQYYELYGYVSN